MMRRSLLLLMRLMSKRLIEIVKKLMKKVLEGLKNYFFKKNSTNFKTITKTRRDGENKSQLDENFPHKSHDCPIHLPSNSELNFVTFRVNILVRRINRSRFSSASPTDGSL